MDKYFYFYFFEIEIILLIIQILLFILFLLKYDTDYLIKKYNLKRSFTYSTECKTLNNSYNKYAERKNTYQKSDIMPNPTNKNKPPRHIIYKLESIEKSNYDKMINILNNLKKKSNQKKFLNNLKTVKKDKIKEEEKIDQNPINNNDINIEINDNNNNNNDIHNDINNIENNTNDNNNDNNFLINDSFFQYIHEIKKNKKISFAHLVFYLKNLMVLFSIFINNDYNIYILKLSLFIFYINSIIYLNNLYNFIDDIKTCEQYSYKFRVFKIIISSIVPLLLFFLLRQLVTTQNSIYRILKDKSLTNNFKNICNKLIIVYFCVIFIFLIINFIISFERYDDCKGKLYYELYDFLIEFIFGTILNFIIVVVYFLIRFLF